MKKPRPTPKTSVGTHATTANPDGDQRKPPSFQRFEPRPPASLGPGIETRHPYRSQSRRHDALLARQKRGVATAQPRNHHKSQDRHPPPKRTNFRCLRGAFWQATRQNFPKKKRSRYLPYWFGFRGRGFSVFDPPTHKIPRFAGKPLQQTNDPGKGEQRAPPRQLRK